MEIWNESLRYFIYLARTLVNVTIGHVRCIKPPEKIQFQLLSYAFHKSNTRHKFENIFLFMRGNQMMYVE